MELMILTGSDDLSAVRQIRRNVFFQEQKADASMIEDDLDQFSDHLLIIEEDNPVATGRLYYKDNYYKIGRIAVDQSMRGKGYGDLIVRGLLRQAFEIHDAKTLVVSAQLHAIEFYKRFGFIESGQKEQKEGVWSRDMTLSREQYCK